MDLFAESTAELTRKGSTTFQKNMSLPIHRWFKYSAGFSAEWVREVIDHIGGSPNVLDPFAGSGTVPLAAELAGVSTIGIEAHPFIARVAKAKLLWDSDIEEFTTLAYDVLNAAEAVKTDLSNIPDLLKKSYDKLEYERLVSLREAWISLDGDSPARELVWLALISIIRECSAVGTAQWQYVLPNKKKKRVSDPYEAFGRRVDLMRADMHTRQSSRTGGGAEVREEDARSCASVPDGWADLVVTSPPYANNYDYADATRLELTFLGEIERWADLQDAVRKYLVRSCSQHVSRRRKETDKILADPGLDPIRSDIEEVCRQMEEVSEQKAGRKAYHTMVAAYFKDMAQVWDSMRRVVRDGGTVCLVVGDSAPYGVHVPVDEWLGRLALASGFESYEFVKVRDRNTKWKNRKHRVPLHEGQLWVK
jgi:DNA modification methylase